MYPFASLPENLTAFCAALRRDYGFRVGPAQLRDAARALHLTRIGDERAVRDTLRPILSSRREHAALFDEAFETFFHPSDAAARQHLDAFQRSPVESPGAAPSSSRSAADAEPELDSGGTAHGDARIGAAVDLADARRDAVPVLLRSSYSPVEAEGESPELIAADRAWRQAASLFVRRVQTALSRRWKPAPRGSRFDLRRTLRSSLHTGGEPVVPRWRARPRLRPRFVVIVDGSRSMAEYTPPALQTAVALAGVTPAVEVFVFSTALEPITRDVRRAAGGAPAHLPDLHHAWGGGTGIGACLRDFVHRHGVRTLGRDTVVIIASDGLDVGAADVLRQAMAELHRRSAALIWLNPLTATAGYEPTALGMRTARTSVTTFSWVADAAGLRRLAGLVRVRS